MSVVLPEDSGPKTSTMRPRGRPPTPSARSSDSAPVGTAETRTWAASSPIFMIDPAPNWRSICVSAPVSAVSRALAAFSCSLSMGSPTKFWDLHRRSEVGRLLAPLSEVAGPSREQVQALPLALPVAQLAQQALPGEAGVLS